MKHKQKKITYVWCQYCEKFLCSNNEIYWHDHHKFHPDKMRMPAPLTPLTINRANQQVKINGLVANFEGMG